MGLGPLSGTCSPVLLLICTQIHYGRTGKNHEGKLSYLNLSSPSRALLSLGASPLSNHPWILPLLPSEPCHPDYPSSYRRLDTTIGIRFSLSSAHLRPNFISPPPLIRSAFPVTRSAPPRIPPIPAARPAHRLPVDGAHAYRRLAVPAPSTNTTSRAA